MLTGQLGRLPFAADAVSNAASSAARGSVASGQRFWSTNNSRQGSQPQWPSRLQQGKISLHAATVFAEAETRYVNSGHKKHDQIELQFIQGFPEANGTLPAALYRLVDPSMPVDLPPAGAIKLNPADNRELDKLVSALGRNKATWRRALILHEWLLQIGHKADDRLCTTLIRVCAQHGQAATALSLYDWMRTPVADGGAGLECTVYTYTAAMRAALMGNMLDRALDVWTHAEANHAHEIDCRLCTTLIEVCARRGDTDRALETYNRMRAAPSDSKLVPTVHAYTAAMRAASEGGRTSAALAIWDDMQAAGCKATGHAYSAVISACAAGGEWQRAVSLFDDMMRWGVKPDVVSCTALVTALGADGQWERAEKVVEWMLRNDIRPNVRTYTALVGALANARQWDRASAIVSRMKAHALGSGVEPNAYTYSALLKAMGDNGKWQMAEALFNELEAEQLGRLQNTNISVSANSPTSTPKLDNQIGSDSGSSLLLKSSDDDLHSLTVPSTVVYSDQTESLEERKNADLVVVRTAELALSEENSLGPLQNEDSNERNSTGSNHVGHHRQKVNVASEFSYFSAFTQQHAHSNKTLSPRTPTSSASSPLSPRKNSSAWTTDNAASKGLNLDIGSALINMTDVEQAPVVRPANGADSSLLKTNNHSNSAAVGSVVNEVVCGALMLAYERAGKWEEAVHVLDRARALGITPNTVMYNTAVSALGKAGKLEAALALFRVCPNPDAVTFETLIAAYGMVGDAKAAEALLKEMRSIGYAPQDYAYCGIIAAHSLKGNWRAALKVKDRAAREGVPPSVHLYNALIAACDRAKQYDKAIELGNEMTAKGVARNAVTQELLEGVCKGGVAAIENQQAAIAALSAAVAAAGTVMMRAGVF